MVVSANGVVTRVSASDISRQGRPATGVKVQNLSEGDSVVSVNKIIDPDDGATTNNENQKAEEDNSVSQTNLSFEE